MKIREEIFLKRIKICINLLSWILHIQMEISHEIFFLSLFHNNNNMSQPSKRDHLHSEMGKREREKKISHVKMPKAPAKE
jgi:hypothetical protein